jgi:hypothetical protein
MVNRTEKFEIIYDGSALKGNSINVKDLSLSLLGIGELIEESNQILFGNDVKIKLEVESNFKPGSFGISFILQQSYQAGVTFFSSDIATAISNFLTIVGLPGALGLIAFIKKLKNRKIESIIIVKDNAVFKTESEEIITLKEVPKLYNSYRIRKAISQSIALPLKNEGIDTFQAKRKNSNDIISVEKNEADFFAVPDIIEGVIDEQIYTTFLQPLKIVFKEKSKNKWSFTDGTSNFNAAILDEEFKKRVSENLEVFAKLDYLKVEVRRKQFQTEKGIKSEYEILKILDHRNNPKQQKLFSQDKKE